VRLTVARYYTPSGRCIQKSYDAGDEVYELDIYNRQKSGELFSLDSMRRDDSLTYYTHSRRTVFGGGGIMPDVFVPLDTSLFSDYYWDLQRKGILNEFALTYVDKNRKKLLAAYDTITVFKSGFETDSLFMKEFFAFAEKREVKKDEAGYGRSRKLLETQLKALVARDLWNSTAYFQIINDINDTYNKALECFRENLFDKMKIAGQ
jgi:carboxyl-terminal processing protease